MGYKLFVFDLDGTLANTAELTTGRRRPYDLLSLIPPGGDTSQISFGQDVCELPGKLMERGAFVFIITRSPQAYASTLTGLLDIDYHLGFASIQNGYGAGDDAHRQALTDTLQAIDPSEIVDDGLEDHDYGFPFELQPTEMVYIGDTPIDQQAAREIGITYFHADWGDGLAEKLLELAHTERNPHRYDPLDPWETSLSTQISEPQWEGVIRRGTLSGIAHDLVQDWDWQKPRTFPIPMGRMLFDHISSPYVDEATFRHWHRRLKNSSQWGIRFNLGYPNWRNLKSETMTRDRTFEELFDAFPPQSIHVEGIGDVHAFASFQKSPLFGKGMYAKAKGWKGFKSGPDVHLGFLNFPAITMASSIAQYVKEHQVAEISKSTPPPSPSDEFSPTTIAALLQELNLTLEDINVRTGFFDELLSLGISEPYNFSGFVREYNFDLAHTFCPYCGPLQSNKLKSFKTYWSVEEDELPPPIDWEWAMANQLEDDRPSYSLLFYESNTGNRKLKIDEPNVFRIDGSSITLSYDEPEYIRYFTTWVFYLFLCPNCKNLFDSTIEGIPSLDEINYTFSDPERKRPSGYKEINSLELFIKEIEPCFIMKDPPPNSIHEVLRAHRRRTLEALNASKETFVVPVPATPCTREQPGQFSERLGHKIAEFGNWEFLNCLEKGTAAGEVNVRGGLELPKAGIFILVDDQLTMGSSMRRAQSALINAGVPASSISRFVWSISEQHHRYNNQDAVEELRRNAQLDQQISVDTMQP